jgi:hypothetical protein
MTNVGIQFIAAIMLLIGMGASFYNSFLIMGLINATSFMWSLWWGSLILVFFGSIMSAISK